MVRRLFFVLLISSVFLLLGCEGPAGPVGPQGPQGPQVEQGKPGSQDPESQPFSTLSTNLVEELVVPNKADCLREASQSSYVDAIRLRTIEAADPDRLTDEERSAWNQFFMNTNSELRSSCIAYWSEAVTVENADKRNALVGDRPNECLESVEQHIQAQNSYELAGNRGAWVDAYTLLRRPYLSLTVAERSILRESLHDSWDCRRYYPQLFSGRWIPLMDVTSGITTGTSAPTATPTVTLAVPTLTIATPPSTR